MLAVVYLIFNEGYAAHSGDALVRHDLCAEAVRLGPHAGRADAGRARGARSPRADGAADLAHRHTRRRRRQPGAARGSGPIALGSSADRQRARLARPGGADSRAPAPIELQAAIAACHARAPPPGKATDWEAIVTHYRALAEIAPSPVVEAEPRGGDRTRAWPGRRARRPRRHRRGGAPRLSPLAGRARRLPPPARTRRRGGRRVPSRARAHRQCARAELLRVATRGSPSELSGPA